MSANPIADGQVQRNLCLPDWHEYTVDVTRPTEATRALGGYLRDAMALNAEQGNLLFLRAR